MAPNAIVGITAAQRDQVSAWLADPPEHFSPVHGDLGDDIDLDF
ncbi:hypothetical protein [Xylanimonas ulmi]|uniref:Uncharacterized protein n=1 Tax=Xylanimonas ulmi TaxID=228973 RepID=A0A4Q7M1T8_9MICO|nr:hypothetical protein [Xylanibacterium ulmi]RZS61211.1 hypothetical protein EV386_1502 [Xylanibacterium ulmi]